MPIAVRCACGKEYKFKDQYAGRRAKCPACGQVVRIPGARPAGRPSSHSPLREYRRSRTRELALLGSAGFVVLVGIGLVVYFLCFSGPAPRAARPAAPSPATQQPSAAGSQGPAPASGPPAPAATPAPDEPPVQTAAEVKGISVKSCKTRTWIGGVGLGGQMPRKYEPAAGKKFLWVEFEVTEAALPMVLDLQTVTVADAKGTTSTNPVGYSTITFKGEETSPHVEHLVELPNTQGRLEMVEISGSSENDFIEASFSVFGKTASITVKKVPVKFSLLFSVPAGAGDFTVHGVGAGPIRLTPVED